MRIGIDARAASHPQPGGFKTYTENLIRHLAQVDGENSYLVYLDREVPANKFPYSPHFIFKVARPPLPFVGVALREQVILPRLCAHDKVDLAHFPCATAALFPPCPFVVTIHDVIELFEWARPSSLWSLETLKRPAMHLYSCYFQSRAAKKARAIITVSQNSRRDIIDHFGVPEDKVFVTYEAPGHIYRLVEDNERLEAVRYKHDLAPHLILALASASPRKNVRGLVQAYAQLGTDLIEKYQLIIVWAHGLLRGEISELIRRSGLAEKVTFLEQVPDEDMVLLYNAADLFVFPSLYEGFGLPLLEAMACGTPVVASNTSSIPEVLGDAALLVDPRDTNALAKAIREVLTQLDLQQSLIKEGFKQVKVFSWEKVARETIAVYQEVARMGK